MGECDGPGVRLPERPADRRGIVRELGRLGEEWSMWRERARYWFDSTMSRGTPALIGWLGLASTLLVLVVSVLVIWLVPGDVSEHGGWPEVFWMTLLRAIDPGTMGGDQGTPLFLFLMLAITLGGI